MTQQNRCKLDQGQICIKLGQERIQATFLDILRDERANKCNRRSWKNSDESTASCMAKSQVHLIALAEGLHKGVWIGIPIFSTIISIHLSHSLYSVIVDK